VAALAGSALAGCAGGDDGGARRAATTTTRAVVGTPGARGAGDPYFPDLGNGGYDVAHYDLALTWQADAGVLEGVATITATATQDLSRFDLDLSGLDVRSATVDDRPATTARDADELVVTPARAIPEGDRFEVVVTYGGRPEPIHQGTDLFRVGWQTHGREAFVASEPAGAATFFPANDHPSDKATYAFHITAPADQVVATNGEPIGRRAGTGGTATWDSVARDPIATYLVQVAIGDFEVVADGTSSAGVPIRHVLHRDLLAAARDTVSRTAQMMDVMSDVWGPYPFESYGVLAVDEPLGFALETQTLSLIGSDLAQAGRDADATLVHELAHQWVGDAVSPATWKDIWLNEGFATYSEWLWSERTGGLSAARLARRVEGEPGLDGPTADPGPDELFQRTVYARGALTLQALREEIGDDAFFRVLRSWVADHAGGSASTADFTALATRVSGKDLTALFDRWLQQPSVPSLPS
jgi:aminopeptidase N